MEEALGKPVLVVAMTRRWCLVMAATPCQKERGDGATVRGARSEPVAAWAHGQRRRHGAGSWPEKRGEERISEGQNGLFTGLLSPLHPENIIILALVSFGKKSQNFNVF